MALVGFAQLKQPAAGGGAVSRTFVDTYMNDSGSATTTTFSSVALGSSANGRILVGISRTGGSTSITSVTAAGNTLTELASSITGSELVYWYEGTCSASTGDIVLTYPSSAAGVNFAAVYRIDGHNTTAFANTGVNANGTLNMNLNTAADGAVFAIVQHFTNANITLAGVTEDDEIARSTTEAFAAGSALTATASTPLTVTGTISGYGNGLSISFQPA